MATRVVPNGNDREAVVLWSPVVKWAARVLGTMVVLGALGTLALHVRVAMLLVEQQALTDTIMQHLSDIGKHEDPYEKMERIRRTIEWYHRNSGDCQTEEDSNGR